MNINILHLSDLHIINKNGTYSEVLGHLIDDIKCQCLYFKHIIIVITGDIIDRANYTEKNKAIAIKFFEDLHEAIGEKVVGVEITPGNHDKEQNKINKMLIDSERENAGLSNIDNKDWDYYLVSYKQYLLLINQIRRIFNKNSANIKNSYYVEVIDEEMFKVFFINLDTSWSSYGGIIDKRNLCLDERQLVELKEEYQKEKRDISKEYITIMTAHHPLNWLNEKCEAFILPWLLNSEYYNINLYLCGHTHDRQIKSFFDTYHSYTTLVTGIGWDEKTPEEEKDKHRYSIYKINIRTNSCEIIIRKTRTDAHFDYDNDVLLTEEEKNDKRICLPLNPYNIKPKIRIPIYRDNEVQNEYLFVDKHILEEIRNVSEVFSEISNHMALFQAMHIRDFFVKYELNKSSKGTIIKQEIYDDYFYKSIHSDKVNELFTNIRNHTIIYNNFVAYLRELCGTVVHELKDKIDDIEQIRLHFRKFYKINDENVLYIAFCQAITDNGTPPAIRDLSYDESMIKIAFEENVALVFSHNKKYNPLPVSNTYNNFITMVSSCNNNTYSYKQNRKDVTRPYLTASLSIACRKETNLLDILNYLNLGDFIFKLVYDYASLFKINMEEFIKWEEVSDQ